MHTTIQITDLVEDEKNYVPEKSEIISAEIMPDDFGREGLVDTLIPGDTPDDTLVIDQLQNNAVIPDIQNTTSETIISEDKPTDGKPDSNIPPISLDTPVIKEEDINGAV